MKAFGLLGSLIALAVGSIYMWKSTSQVVSDNPSETAENVPAMAAEVTNKANAQIAELEKAMKRIQEQQPSGQ